MQKLFGTDGIRGKADEFPLDEATVRLIGASLTDELTALLGRPPKLIFGRDTRESGERIETAFNAGATARGAEGESAGVITTPGVAFLTGKFGFDAGIVISASHNPYQDNGIKIFAPDGKKMSRRTEIAIEAAVTAGKNVQPSSKPIDRGRTAIFCRSYIEHLQSHADGLTLNGMRIVVDCANGAAWWLGPELYASLGANVETMNVEPDGRNINLDCGSLHLQGLSEVVVQSGADLGVAFDGDADRALFVDEYGNVVDGDATLWILAAYLRDHGKLANSTVVATVMSNIGLEIAFKEKGIELLRTDVGDKYVLEKLTETGSEIGGEQSGHIILPEISMVGDGMMTALLMLKAIRERDHTLSQAIGDFIRYPQILLNVPVREKRPFDDVPEIADMSERIREELGDEGRLLLRYSGTESLARVMIEGKDQSVIEDQANRLAEIIKNALG